MWYTLLKGKYLKNLVGVPEMNIRFGKPRRNLKDDINWILEE
jgi:hypothetical protein